MPFNCPRVFTSALCALGLVVSGCKPHPNSASQPEIRGSDVLPDAVQKEVLAYRGATRAAYNSRHFDELDQNAAEVRASKAKFGNGSWKLWHFYDSLGCADSEPESMWQLHADIHKAWIAAKPDSVTAHVAQVAFLFEYAWRARGTGFAGTVTPAMWQLFGERLKVAHQALLDCRETGETCPVWWAVGLRLSIGEQWPRADADSIYKQAKEFEPTFWNFDTIRNRYLSLKWYGASGEWETAAEEAAADPKGLGLEVYARCVLEQMGNYADLFKESRADWSKAQAGLELMQQRYPDSHEVSRAYCRLACVYGDQSTAKRLFEQLGEYAFGEIWVTRDYYERCRAWAEKTP